MRAKARPAPDRSSQPSQKSPPPDTACRDIRRDRRSTNWGQTPFLPHFMSVSFIAALPKEQRSHVQSQLEQLVATHPDLRGQPVVRFPYRTLAFHCERER
jgi:hypothetical protein